MANHKSSIKRIRQTEKRKLHNRYYAKTARNAVRKMRATTEKAAAADMFPKISSMLISWQNVTLFTKIKLRT
jgi:small subunit ribosomal protein S20